VKRPGIRRRTVVVLVVTKRAVGEEVKGQRKAVG